MKVTILLWALFLIGIVLLMHIGKDSQAPMATSIVCDHYGVSTEPGSQQQILLPKAPSLQHTTMLSDPTPYYYIDSLSPTIKYVAAYFSVMTLVLSIALFAKKKGMTLSFQKPSRFEKYEVYYSVFFFLLILGYLTQRFKYTSTRHSPFVLSKLVFIDSELNFGLGIGICILIIFGLYRYSSSGQGQLVIPISQTAIHRLSFRSFCLLHTLLVRSAECRLLSSEEITLLTEIGVPLYVIASSNTVRGIVPKITHENQLFQNVMRLYRTIYCSDNGNNGEIFFNLTSQCYFLDEPTLLVLFSLPYLVNTQLATPDIVRLFQSLFPNIFNNLNGDETIGDLLGMLPQHLGLFFQSLGQKLLLPYLNEFYPNVAKEALVQVIMRSTYVNSNDSPEEIQRKGHILIATIDRLLTFPNTNLAILASMRLRVPVYSAHEIIDAMSFFNCAAFVGPSRPDTVQAASLLLSPSEQILFTDPTINAGLGDFLAMKRPAILKLIVLRILTNEDQRLASQFDEIFERVIRLREEQLVTLMTIGPLANDDGSHDSALDSSSASELEAPEGGGPGHLQNNFSIHEISSQMSPAEQIFYRDTLIVDLAPFILKAAFYRQRMDG